MAIGRMPQPFFPPTFTFIFYPGPYAGCVMLILSVIKTQVMKKIISYLTFAGCLLYTKHYTNDCKSIILHSLHDNNNNEIDTIVMPILQLNNWVCRIQLTEGPCYFRAGMVNCCCFAYCSECSSRQNEGNEYGE